VLDRADGALTSPPSSTRGFDRGLLVCGIALVVVSFAITYAFWPGHMSSDTLSQIDAVRSGKINDWHAGLLIVLWRPFWLLGVGVTPVYFLSVCTFVLGFASIIRLLVPRAVACLYASVLVLTPQVLGYLGYFGRDQWFVSLLMGAGGALALASRRAGWCKILWLLVALAGISLLMGARQNGIPFALALMLPWVELASPHGIVRRLLAWLRCDGRRWRTRVVHVSLAVGLTGGLVVVNSSITRAAGVGRSHPEQATFIYDLATMSTRRDEILLDAALFPAQDLALLQAQYNPYSVDPLLFGTSALIPFPVQPADFSALRSAWLRAIRADPVDYLQGRWHIWTRQIGWSGHTWWFFHPYVDPNPWGYEIEHRTADRYVQHYLRWFDSGPWLDGGDLLRPWPYLLMAALGLLFLRSSRPQRRFVGWLCVGAIGYEVTVFVGAMGVQYRYSLPVVITGLLVVVATVVWLTDDAPRWWKRLRGSDAPARPGESAV